MNYFFSFHRYDGPSNYITRPPIGSNGWTINGQRLSKIIKITKSSAENCKQSDAADDESPEIPPTSGDTTTERILFPGTEQGNKNILKGIR